MKNKGALLVSVCMILVLVMMSATAGAVKPQKKLIIAVPGEPDALDFSIGTATSWPILYNMMDMLAARGPDGKLVHGLTSWKISDDGKEVEFTIRKGVKFHSGDPLTVEDFEFSYQRAEDNVQYSARFRSTERFEAIDDSRFKIIFREPDVTFFQMLGFPIVCRSYYDRVGLDKYAREPVGTGPYKFVSYKPGQYIEFAAFEDYWGEKPSVKAVRFVFVSNDTTRVAMLRAGEADIMMEVPFPLVKGVENTQGLKIVRDNSDHPSPSIHFQLFNPKTPWYDRRVRLAIAHAIDAEAIIKQLLMGLPNRWPRLASWQLGYDPELKNYPYDPDRAKQLLKEAGYPNGFDMPLNYPIGRMAMIKETAEAVVLYLSRVGIKVKPRGMEFARYQQRLRDMHKNHDDVFVGLTTLWGAGGDPTSMVNWTFEGAANQSPWANSEVDKLQREAMNTIDETKRAEIIKKQMRIIHHELPTLTLWNNVSTFGMKDNIDYTPSKEQFLIITLMLVKNVKVR